MWESNQQGHGDQLDDGFRGGGGSQFSSLWTESQPFCTCRKRTVGEAKTEDRDSNFENVESEAALR